MGGKPVDAVTVGAAIPVRVLATDGPVVGRGAVLSSRRVAAVDGDGVDAHSRPTRGASVAVVVGLSIREIS